MNVSQSDARVNRRFIEIVVALALFMDALDTTILNTAIPLMASSLHVQPIDLKIALISYLVSLSILIPISGWIADKYGIKRVFIMALAIFSISSMWCGFSRTVTEITIARACQGIGGALLLPLGRLIILQTYQRHELVSAMNSVVMIVSLGVMLGPLAGGFITDHFAWQWIFWINIPVGLLAIWLGLIYLRENPPRDVRSFDWIGFFLFASGLSILTFSLCYLSESQASHTIAFIWIGLSLLMLFAYYLYAKKQRIPLINVKLLEIRTFKISVLANLLARVGFGGVPFLLPLLFQISLGYSAMYSGFLVAPIAIGIFTVKAFSLPLLRFFGYKRLLLVNTVLVGFSLWSMQLINGNSSTFFIISLTFIFGFLICLQYSAVNSIAYADVHAEELSGAASIVSTIQQLAQSFGVAAGAILLQLHALQNTSGHLMLTLDVFHQAFFTMGLFIILTMVIFLQLELTDGNQMLFQQNENTSTVA